LDIRKNVLGEQHPDYAKSLSKLGSLYIKLGDYPKAEMYLWQALKICTSLGDDVFAIQDCNEVSSLHSLGVLFCLMGDLKEGEIFLLQALNLQKDVLGKQDPDLLICLAYIYGSMLDIRKAEAYFIQALEIQRSVLGEQHPAYANSLKGLGLLYYDTGDYERAEVHLQEMYSLCKSSYVSSTKYMTEQQRQCFWDTQAQYIWSFLEFLYLYQLEKPSVSKNAYDVELFTKGLLLTSSDVVNRSIMESKDSVLIQDFQDLKSLRQRIMNLQERDPQSPYIGQYQHQADSLEKVLTINSAIFRESQAIWDITWDSVRNHLKATDVAIEYMDVPLAGDSTMYCALLLRDTCSYPVMIPLFEEKEVLPLATATTNGEFAPDKVYSDTINGKELTAKIWSKIMPYIKPGETVYFAPSGLLHQLAIEALPYDSTHTMADVYNMVRLSSTREIVMHKNDNRYTTATLYGGIQYDVNADTLLAESRRYAQDELLASRGIEDDTLDRGDIKYLAWTKTEVEDISDLLQKNKLQVHLFTSTSANEESFKALSGKHQNILHIATHGFFWTDSTAQKKDYFTQRMMPFGNDRPTPPSIDPLNRCGLLFAGAQTAWSGHSADLTDGVQDGILTAKEISLLDLRDADLVVLSACETAKGEITSDGVFGLQRAFKQAGAQTIIMSLWPVNDESTQLLMTEFYRNWITYHQSKREAFRNAQNTVRAKYEEPYYWAGFIMLD
jgi:CHAT domain-containing protein/tetratricopeptide (TPR) repeat protein